MRIGKDKKKLKDDDIVYLKMEPSAGRGKITHTKYSERLGIPIYWCEFPNRSDGYFNKDDLNCDRLDREAA